MKKVGGRGVHPAGNEQGPGRSHEIETDKADCESLSTHPLHPKRLMGIVQVLKNSAFSCS